MANVKILDYVAKNADVISYEEMSNCGVAFTHMDGLFIVSRKFSCLSEPSHEVFKTFADGLARYNYIVNNVRK